MSVPSPFGFPAIGNQEVYGAVPTTDAPGNPTLLYSATFTNVTTNQIGPTFNPAGYRYLQFLGNLSAITAGSVLFRLKAVGAFYNTDVYKINETAAGTFPSQSVGPGMQTQSVLFQQMFVECDVTTGPATFTVEVWGWP